MNLFAGYRALPATFDELFSADGALRPDFQRALGSLGSLSREDYSRAQGLAELALLNQGVTFSVYADERGSEKIFPFCLIPPNHRRA